LLNQVGFSCFQGEIFTLKTLIVFYSYLYGLAMNKILSQRFVMNIFRKDPGETLSNNENIGFIERFTKNAETIYQRHFDQDLDKVQKLKNRYSKNVFGKIKVVDAIRMLSECVDPSDTELFCTSQLVHTLQVVESMTKAKMSNDMIMLGLVHDLGKILLLLGDEDPANIVCPNELIGSFGVGVGLDNVITHWSHDEYIYHKLYPFLNKDSLWLLRYHSFRFDIRAHVLSKKDLERKLRLLDPFRVHDLKSKSCYVLPSTKLDDYADFLEKYFPVPIEF
jgi:hypothetical protein